MIGAMHIIPRGDPQLADATKFSSTESLIRRHVRAHAAQAVAFLAELVRTPSDNPPGDCRNHAEKTASLLEALGWVVERHPVPAALCKRRGMITATNLIVRRRFGSGPIVALSTHGDVVPPGTGWTQDPYGARIENGHMYGRGVAVSKSDIASYAFALLAVQSLAAVMTGSVELHITYDEEAGGEIGPRYLLDQGLSKPTLAIGAGFSYAVVTAHSGCVHMQVQVLGRSAHAAKPWTGIDALEAANHILAALYTHRRSLASRSSAITGIGSPQLTIGLISGGTNTNVVPDSVTFRLDRRILPEEDVDAVARELEAIIAGAARACPTARVAIERVLLAEPLRPTAKGARLAQVLCRRASQVMGVPVTASGSPLYTDARHYAANGIPIVLYGAGPRTIEDANAHGADERLDVSDLAKATQVIALTLHDVLHAPDASR
jgi:succinyl-diaminopimelate desuccinylase